MAKALRVVLQDTLRPDADANNILYAFDHSVLDEKLQSCLSSLTIVTEVNDLPPSERRPRIESICRLVEQAAVRAGREVDIVLKGSSTLGDLLKDVGSLGEPDLCLSKNGKEGAQPMQYQRLGNSGLKVSRLILGCMTFGNPAWEGSPWVMSEREALPLLKKAYDVGINTWETADTYSNGESERIVGKALREYNIPRSKVVIITKLYYPVLEDEPNARPQPALNDGKLANQMGLSRKHIFEAVEGSLRRLGTDYIDVLQLHRLDQDTPSAEIMRALHDLVTMGKVHYLGASSMYCWQFARLQYTAKMNRWTEFTCMSGLYNLLYREEEREMIPFCKAEGVGLIPWSPIARGLLTRPWSEKTDRSKQDVKTKKWFQGGQNEGIVTRVERLARAKGCTMSSMALAWLLHKGACPVVGLNSIDRIEAASEALDIILSAEEMSYLEELYEPLQTQAM